MTKFSKRIISLLAFTVICTGVLSGCSSSKEKNTSKTDTETVTLNFYTWEKSGYTEQQDNIKKAFEEKNKNIKINYIYPTDNNNNDYVQKMNTILMAGNNDVDILGSAGEEEIVNWSNAGLMEPLDDHFKKEGIKYEDKYKYPLTIKGKMYTISTFETAWFVLLNKDLLDKAGLPVPPLDWTWDDYREYAKKLTSGEGSSKVFGSYMHTWVDYNKMGIYSMNDINLLYDKSGKLLVDKPMFKDWMKYRFDLENNDKTQVPYAQAKSMNLAYRSLFFNGEVAMLPTGEWMTSEIKNVEKYPHDFVTAFAPLPKFEDGVEGQTTLTRHSFGISAKSKHKDEAYKFLSFYAENRSKIGPMTGFTCAVDQDKGKVSDEIIGDDKKYYDVESLKKVLNNPKFKGNFIENADILIKENVQVSDMVNEECGKYLIGSQSLDKLVENINNRYDQMKTK